MKQVTHYTKVNLLTHDFHLSNDILNHMNKPLHLIRFFLLNPDLLYTFFLIMNDSDLYLI